MNNREKLIALITDNGLERGEVADMVKVKRDVVDHWLASGESRHHETIPDMAIELLELKIKLRNKE